MSPAATGCGRMHEAGHHPGDGAQLQGLQTQQAADAEGGAHDGEAGEAAEAGAGEKAKAEASGDLSFSVKGSDRCRYLCVFCVSFLCFLQIPGISQQHPAARKGL